MKKRDIYLALAAILAIFCQNAMAVPTFQAYIDNGTAGTHGDDKQTWFTGNSTFDLIVAGDKPELLVSAAGCRGLIIPGHIDEEDLPVIYKEAKLFVFPSLYEGFGLPPLEAMSYGVPVIASNRPAMKEILENAVEFFEPQDDKALAVLMEKILTSKEDRKRLFQKGIEQVNKYDFKRNIEIILNTMEAVAIS